MSRLLLILVLISTIVPVRAAEHSPLLPRPQEIQYGPQTIPVSGLGVRLPAGASAEDLFAANTLSACLSDRARVAIPVSQGEASDHMIYLRRTGAVDSLPVPGDQASRQSREAYSLRVNSRPNRAQCRLLRRVVLWRSDPVPARRG